jgi:hypothetical protein
VARWTFKLGEFFETLTKGELDDSLAGYRAAARAEELEKARGRKYMRLNPPVTGIAVASVLQIGGDFPNTGPGGTLTQPPQPRAGYAWAMRRMSVTGLTAGTTPDIVNLLRRTGGKPCWQFNGNNFGYTFSHEQIVFLEGETPVLVSVGTFAATGMITLDADFVEVPQPELVKVA